MGGVEANWSLLSDISMKISDPLLIFFVQQFSKKAERKASYYQLASSFNSSVIDLVPRFREYLGFKLYYEISEPYSEFAYLVSSESNSPIIDRYLSLVNILFELINSPLDFRDTIHDTITLLGSHITGDYRLHHLKALLDPLCFQDFPGTVDILRTMDEYTEGNYSYCLDRIPLLITQYPGDILNYTSFTLNRSWNLILNIVSPTFHLLLTESWSCFISLLFVNNIYTQSDEELKKLALSFSSHGWSKQLSCLVDRLTNAESNHSKANLVFTLNSQINNPRSLYFYKMDSPEQLQALLHYENFDGSLTAKLLYWMSSNQTDKIKKSTALSVRRKPVYIARVLVSSKRLVKPLPR